MSDDTKMVLVRDQGIQPANIGELYRLAESAAASKFFGAAGTPEQGLMIMLAGRDLGFSYTQSLRAFQVIKGKPSLSADAMVAVCLSRKDLCEYFTCTAKSAASVTWETKRVGSPASSETFTIEDAKKAGLLNDMYQKYPTRMLSARCKAFLARDVYPELLMGLYDPDELQPAPMPVQAPAIRIVDRPRHPPTMITPADDEEVAIESEAAHENVDHLAELSRRIEDAATQSDLDDIAVYIQTIKLTQGELAAIKGVWKEKRDALRGAA